MKRKEYQDIIEVLEIKLKHLQNDFLLTKEESETTSMKYLESMLELKEKNQQLVDLQKNLEQMVDQRTEQLEEAQKVLQQKSEELQIMVDSSPSMIFIKDIQGRYQRVNKAFVEVTGLPLKKITGKTDEEIFTEKGQCFSKEDLKVIQTEKPLLNKEEIFKTRKDEKILLIDKIPFRNFDGKIVGIIGFALDITERKQLEEEQSKASKLESIGILAGGIAHDFNNILTSILMNISLAKLYGNKDKKITDRLLEAENATMRAQNLTKQLLTFSMGGTPIKRITEISELIRETSCFSLRGSNVKCRLFLPDDLWPAEIDEGQISQVINNLVINSDQAMPEGGTMQIRAENVSVGPEDNLPFAEGKYVKIDIEDEGCGIHKKYLPKIFDPYFTTKKKGSGLGLASVYSIIKNHGGHIEVDSEPGVGTRFQLCLPAYPAKYRKKKEKQQELLMEKGKILLMDDDVSIRKAVSAMLKVIGHEVEAVCDGAEAIKEYKKAKGSSNPFDAVILDLTIPGALGGKEAIKRLLKIDPEVRAIVSSGYSRDPVLSDFKKHGFRGFVHKPYRLETLKEALVEVMSEKR
jgi:PAS domain S-box-containing protein